MKPALLVQNRDMIMEQTYYHQGGCVIRGCNHRLHIFLVKGTET